MKKAQLTAVLVIVLLVAAVAGFLIFSQKKAGRSTFTLSSYQQQQYQQQQYTGQDQTISVIQDGGTSSDSLIGSPCDKETQCDCTAPSVTWEGECKKEAKDPKGGYPKKITFTQAIYAGGIPTKEGSDKKGTIDKKYDGKKWSCTVSGYTYAWSERVHYDVCPSGASEEKEQGGNECARVSISSYACGWWPGTEDSFAAAAKAALTACLAEVHGECTVKTKSTPNGYANINKANDPKKGVITSEFKGFTDKKT